MALVVVEGNLLQASGVDVIMHQANCQGVMGKGIAKDIKEMFPAAQEANLRYYPNSPESKLGKMTYAVCPHPSFAKHVVVVNLYGQLDYWRTGEPRNKVWTNYEALQRAIQMAFDEPISILVEDMGLTNPVIGIPYGVGCGLANGDWNVVSAMLHEVSEKVGFDIHAYKL